MRASLDEFKNFQDAARAEVKRLEGEISGTDCEPFMHAELPGSTTDIRRRLQEGPGEIPEACIEIITAYQNAQAEEEAQTMAFDMQKEVFEAINEDLRLQQESALQKQLDQQRNQIFNDAKADVELFNSTKAELEGRIEWIRSSITEQQGAPVIDQE